MNDELIEQVARAMCKIDNINPDATGLYHDFLPAWKHYIKDARKQAAAFAVLFPAVYDQLKKRNAL